MLQQRAIGRGFTLLWAVVWGLLLCGVTAYGQDTTVVAEGKILNALTKELVEARITFSSLPYASKVGYMRGSTYSLPLYDNEKYSLVVTAKGYEPYKVTLDPAEGNPERKLVHDILLKSPNEPVPVVQQPVEVPKPNVGETTRLNILFAQSSFTILPASYSELDALASTLIKHSTMEIQLEGHTDVAGDARSNMKLSKDRVDAVKKYLILKGISGSRIKTKAFGETQPLSTAGTAEAARQNRRVEMRVLKN